MTLSRALIVPLMVLASPLAAQSSPPQTAGAATPAAPPSAERVAAAKPVIDKLWPLGTYRKMMGGQMSEMVNNMMEAMYGMNAEDMLPENDVKSAGKGKTLGELAQGHDPHFRERMRIMLDVMFTEMTPVMDKAEPSVRTALTTIYANKFTVPQLADLDRFLATPTGKAYAENWVTSFYSPELVTAMKGVTPEIMKMMPDIMKKFETATAHLPPPPQPADDAAEAAAKAADDAIAAIDDTNPTGKWSQADRDIYARLKNEEAISEQKWSDASTRANLHALEAKQRSGQKLDDEEKDNLDYLRALLKDQK